MQNQCLYCDLQHFLLSSFLQISSWSSPDACDPNPCENNAKCHSMEQDFYCACPEGYEGKTCERLKVDCKEKTCQGAQGKAALRQHSPNYCIIEEQNITVLFTSAAIDSCTVAIATNGSDGVRHISSNVCGLRGRCISQPGGNFSCVCDPGFGGVYCHESTYRQPVLGKWTTKCLCFGRV